MATLLLVYIMINLIFGLQRENKIKLTIDMNIGILTDIGNYLPFDICSWMTSDYQTTEKQNMNKIKHLQIHNKDLLSLNTYFKTKLNLTNNSLQKTEKHLQININNNQMLKQNLGEMENLLNKSQKKKNVINFVLNSNIIT
eukprot:515221_1